MNNAQVLSEIEKIQITQFKECGHIGIRSSNLLLNFTKREFQVFARTFQSIVFDEHCVTFSDDHERLIMNTPVHSIQLCFTQNEFDDFKQALGEAAIILQSRTLISNN